MSTKRWDVVVAGAGPAGAITAYCLAKEGAKVALVDRARFPREKACGGGVQAKTARLIPFDISPVVETRLDGITLSWQFRHHFTRRWPETLVYGVRRTRFDDFLLERALEAGATLYDGTVVRTVEPEADGVRLRTDKVVLLSDVLVGADGANTTVGRGINPPTAFKHNIALYSEVPREWLRPDYADDGLMRLNSGNLLTGYAWIFPKGETINVGVGGPQMFGKRYRSYFAEFLRAEGVMGRRAVEDVACSGHKIPHATSRTRFRVGRVLLVGDAAGLADPSTGDGLYTSVASGRIAAEVIAEALGGEIRRLVTYEDRIQREILPELIEARAIVAFVNLSPRLFHRLLRHADWKWEEICHSITGERTYYELRDPYRALWTVLDPLLNGIDDLRMRRVAAAMPRTAQARRATGLLPMLRPTRSSNHDQTRRSHAVASPSVRAQMQPRAR